MKTTEIFRYLGMLLPLWWVSGVGALPPTPELRYLADVWQLEQGLPQITVYTVLQGPGDYLWMGTEEGLTRFDGLRFTTFDRRNTPEMRSHVIWTLADDGEEGLWIGTQGGGLNRWQDGQFSLYTTADGLVHNDIQTLLRDPAGDLWIGTRQGLSRFDGEGFSNYTTEDGLAHDLVNALHRDRRGVLWIGTEGGLSRLAPDGLTSYTTSDGLSHDRIFALEEDREGRLWVGTFDGLDYFEDGRLAGSLSEGLAFPSVRTLLEDSSGVLWIGTDGGLSQLENGTAEVVRDQPAETLETLVWSLAEDREGSLWIGTRAGGVVRMRPRRIGVIGAAEGLADELVWSVFEDRQDNVWVGTNRGVTRLDPQGGVRSFATDYTVRSIFEDARGKLWFGTRNHGLGRLEGGELQLQSLVPGAAQPRVNCFLEDLAGNLWVGTTNGLFRRGSGDVESWQDESVRIGLPSLIVRALHLDASGDVWIVTDAGLVQYDGAETHVYGSDEGLLIDSLTTIHEDSEGALWIGTRGAGLARLRGGAFEMFNLQPGTFDVYRILDDGRGRLWMSSNVGIASVEKQQLEEYAAGRLDEVRSVSYGTVDGMESRECNGGSQPAGWKLRDGRLLFPTIRGLAVVDPRTVEAPVPSPRVLIEEVTVDGRRIKGPQVDRVEISPGARTLEFRYTATSFLSSEKIRFRYRLEGFDEAWVEAGTRRTTVYTNLDPGRYRFRVMALPVGGVWTEPGADLEFFLHPAFHQTWLFLVLVSATGLLLLWGLHRLRVRGLLYRSRLRMLEAKNEEMERFTYTVSHDLKSPLTTIVGFLGLLQQDLAAGQGERVERDIERIQNAALQMGALLDDLLELSRLGLAIDSAREEVPLYELAQEAVELVAGRIHQRGVEVVISPDLPVVLGDRRRLLQVLQNLLDNAVKFMGSEPSPRIEIGSLPGGSKEKGCYVRDNGVGIEPEDLSRIFGLFDRLHRDAEGTGIGLALVERIIHLHGGRVWVESEGAGKGSTFYFTIDSRVDA